MLLNAERSFWSIRMWQANSERPISLLPWPAAPCHRCQRKACICETPAALTKQQWLMPWEWERVILLQHEWEANCDKMCLLWKSLLSFFEVHPLPSPLMHPSPYSFHSPYVCLSLGGWSWEGWGSSWLTDAVERVAMVLPGGECSCNRRLAVCQWQLGEKEEGGVSGVCVYMTIHVWREVLSNFRTTFTY